MNTISFDIDIKSNDRHIPLSTQKGYRICCHKNLNCDSSIAKGTEYRIQNAQMDNREFIELSLYDFVDENGMSLPPFGKDAYFPLCFISSKKDIIYSLSQSKIGKSTGIIRQISDLNELNIINLLKIGKNTLKQKT